MGTVYPPPGGSRLIGKTGVETDQILGDVTVTFGSSGSWGSWVQVTASTTGEIVIPYVAYSPDSLSTVAARESFYVQIGVGAGGAEVVKGTAVLHVVRGTVAGHTAVPPARFGTWPRVTAGQRVAVRGTRSTAVSTAGSATVMCCLLSAVEGS